MSEQLARVKWKMGQTLLPEHLIAQEESIIEESILRFNTIGLPGHGISALKFNDTLLLEGVLSIQSLTLIMPSGLLLNAPGNASISPFNLNATGSVKVSVYCHIIINESEDNVGQVIDSDEEDIPRIIYKIILSSSQVYPDALEAIKLGEFEKNPEEKWLLTKKFIPQLIQIGKSPFFISEIDNLLHT